MLIEKDTKQAASPFLDGIFEHILEITKGDCSIDQEVLANAETEQERNVLNGLLYLHEDIELYKTELRNAMEAEYKVKVLAEKNKELEQFTYIASHDLQEPLRSVISFSSILQVKHAKDLDKDSKSYLDIIVNSSKKMSRLIKGLLEYSRIGKAKEISNVDCNLLVKEIKDDLSNIIVEKNAKVIEHNLPQLNAFDLELRLLFQNLLCNSLKFSKKEVSPEIIISCKKQEDGFLFTVQDNGIGIDPAYHSKIFKMFQRLNRAEEYEGTGTGLGLCAKIAELHGGKIWVKSALNEGTQVIFKIPFLNKK